MARHADEHCRPYVSGLFTGADTGVSRMGAVFDRHHVECPDGDPHAGYGQATMVAGRACRPVPLFLQLGLHSGG